MKRLVAVLATVVMVLSPGAAIGQGGSVALAPQDATLTSTGMHSLVDVSKNGTIVLGKITESGPYVIRDIVRGKTLRTLKSGSRYSYKSLSSTGRYVHFTKSYTRNGCTYQRPWVYDRITRKSRLAAATRTGKPLRATWSRPDQCPDISVTGVAFGMKDSGGPGQMSPDGRYVAFCANLKVPDRGDLYIKNMRTRKLTIRKGRCHLTTEAFEFYPVHVSESARTVMILHEGGRADVLLGRKIVRNVAVPAAGMWLTDDGRSIYYSSGGTGASTDGGRYDIATGAVTPLGSGDPMRWELKQPGDEFRDAEGMSRRGRYVSYNGYRTADPDVGRVGLIGVYDRASGLSVDLTAVLTAAGIPLQLGSSYIVPNSLVPAKISGDGRVVLVGWGGEWLAARWMG
jgi:hypothetical protein